MAPTGPTDWNTVFSDASNPRSLPYPGTSASLVCSTSVRPPRSTVSETAVPGLVARIALCSCVQLVILTPLNAVTVSPTFRPARTAADFGASTAHLAPATRAAFEGCTQGVTAATWLV